MTFYNDALPLPQELRTETFVLKPLTPEYAVLDYESYTRSPEMIHIHSGGRWPIENFSLPTELDTLRLVRYSCLENNI